MTTHCFSTFGTVSCAYIYRSGETPAASSGQVPEHKNVKNPSKVPEKATPKKIDQQAQQEANRVAELTAELHDIAAKSNLVADIKLLPNHIYKFADLASFKSKMIDAMRLIGECLHPEQIKKLNKITMYLVPGTDYTKEDQSKLKEPDWIVLTGCSYKSTEEIVHKLLTRLEPKLHVESSTLPPPVQYEIPHSKVDLEKQLHGFSQDGTVQDVRLWHDEDYDVGEVAQHMQKIKNVISNIHIVNENGAENGFFLPLKRIPLFLNPTSALSSFRIKEGYHPKAKAIGIDITESEDEIMADIRKGVAEYTKTLSGEELQKILGEEASARHERDMPRIREGVRSDIERKAAVSEKEREKKSVDNFTNNGLVLAKQALSSKKLNIPILKNLPDASLMIAGLRDVKTVQDNIESGNTLGKGNEPGAHFFRVKTKDGSMRYLMGRDGVWSELVVSKQDVEKANAMKPFLLAQWRQVAAKAGSGIRIGGFYYDVKYPGCLCARYVLDDDDHASEALDNVAKILNAGHSYLKLGMGCIIGSSDTERIKAIRGK